jgi:hypothetical protein
LCVRGHGRIFPVQCLLVGGSRRLWWDDLASMKGFISRLEPGCPLKGTIQPFNRMRASTAGTSMADQAALRAPSRIRLDPVLALSWLSPRGDAQVDQRIDVPPELEYLQATYPRHHNVRMSTTSTANPAPVFCGTAHQRRIWADYSSQQETSPKHTRGRE